MIHQEQCHHHKTCIDHVSIFSNLTDSEKEKILGTSVHRKYHKGEFIYLPGDRIDNLIVVLSGLIKISRISQTGKEQIVQVLKPEDFMGELNLFSPKEAADTAEVIEDALICIIRGTDIKSYLLGNPDAALKLLTKFSERVKEAETLVGQMSLKRIEARIADFIIGEINREDLKKEPYEVMLPFSKKDMAAFLGTTPETLSRKLSLFRENGWIESDGQRRIIVLNKEALEDLSEE
jgi:CRP/FNR family transcriptional regulator